MENKLILGLVLGLFLIAIIPAADALICSLNSTFVTGYIVKGDGNPATNVTVNCSNIKGAIGAEQVVNVTCKYKPTGASSWYFNATALPRDYNETANANQTIFGMAWNLSHMGFDKKVSLFCEARGKNNTKANTSVVDGIIINNTRLTVTATSPADSAEVQNENGTVTWTCTASEESTSMTLNFNSQNYAMTPDARYLVFTYKLTDLPTKFYEWKCTGADTDGKETPSSSYNTLGIYVKGIGSKIPPQIISKEITKDMNPALIVILAVVAYLIFVRKK